MKYLVVVGVVVAAAAAAWFLVLAPPRLTAAEELRIAQIGATFSGTRLDGSGYDETLQGVDDLIALCRAKPDAKYDGLTVQQIAADEASAWEPYRPEITAALDRGCG